MYIDIMYSSRLGNFQDVVQPEDPGYGVYLIGLTHGIDLARAFESRHPRNAVFAEQLGSGLDAVDDIDVVKDTGLDDPHTIDATETVAVAEEGGAAVRAEIAGDGLAAVGRLADRFGRAAQQGEVGQRYNNVVAVVASADLTAIATVAEGLRSQNHTSVNKIYKMGMSRAPPSHGEIRSSWGRILLQIRPRRESGVGSRESEVEKGVGGRA